VLVGPGAIVAAPAAIVLAEAATNQFDPYSLIGTIVTPVIVVALLLFGKLHTEADYQRLADELEASRAEQMRLQTALTDRVIPALTRSTLVLEALSPIIQTEVRLRAAARAPDPDGG
jgi:hypothetical protein